MKKSLSIKILVLALGLSLVPVAAHTLPNIPRDYPHNTSHNIECVYCHFIHDELPWTSQPTVTIDDTYWNKLCRSCHFVGLSAPPTMKTHSSEQLGLKYGDADNDGQPGWSIECWKCHLVHKQDQVSAYGSDTYLDTGTSTNIIANFPAPVAGIATSQLIDTGKGWTGNQFKGMLLIIDRSLSHPFSFNYVITENTSDTITFKEIIPLGAETGQPPGPYGILTTAEDYAIAYGKLIRDKITTPNSGVKDVKLFRPEGADSFADAVGNYEGVCEVCHTQTENPETGSERFRNTAHNDLHNKGLNCVQCHIHTEGFQTNCNLCHGYPPIGLPDGARSLVEDISGSPGTQSVTEGAHFQHTDMKMFECKNCHFGSVGLGDEHNNSLTITMGFSLFGGVRLGGTYNGQLAPVQYNTATGNPTGTTVTNSNTLQCSTIYCHSNANPFGIGKSNQYQTPVWDDVNPMTCTSCHKAATDATYGLSGRHKRHTADNYTLDCEACHVQTADGSAAIKGEPGQNNRYHVNNAKDVIFAAGGNYTAVDSPCVSTYCHSDAAGNPPITAVQWDGAESSGHSPCDSCHRGRPSMDTLVMNSNGHGRLVDDSCAVCIREYPCFYCHDNTVKDDGSLDIKSYSAHLTGSAADDNEIDIFINSRFEIDALIAWDSTKTPKYENLSCMNVYCHSDGTSVHRPDEGAPISVREFAWTSPTKGCNACHGHEDNTCGNCHEPRAFSAEEGWLSAMPMYENRPDISKPNSHFRHLFTGFSCQDCHNDTVTGGACDDCHTVGVPTGNMGESQHVDPFYHVDGQPTVKFAGGGSYSGGTCTSTVCHIGALPPAWGGDVDDDALVCLQCHGDAGPDVDNFLFDDGKRALINMSEWTTTGHGRTSGNYPSGRPGVTGNPPAAFPGNPCWYCHDNDVLHNDTSNPFRLLMHNQYSRRFEKECVYCHMKGDEAECISCHYTTESTLAPQVDEDPTFTVHGSVLYDSACNVTGCHDTGTNPHTGSGDFWTQPEMDEVKSQYEMMGVCLKCHEEDSDNKCTQCHAAAPNIVQNHNLKFEARVRHFSAESNEPDQGVNWTDYWTQLGAAGGSEDAWLVKQAYSDNKFEVGLDPGPGFVTAVTSKAQSAHFGYRHYNQYKASTTVHDIDGTASSSAPDAGELTDNDGPGTPWGEASVVRHNGIKYMCVTSHTSAAGASGNEPGYEGADWKTYWRELGIEAGPDTWADATPYAASQWRGKHVMMADGPNAGESRLIDGNNTDTLFLVRDFTNNVESNNSYFIYSPVWKGGKFCWDCHDPHGDNNLYMIQEYVSTETDGLYGIPTQTRRVMFTERDSPDDYARSTNDDGGTEPYYERICNVCHSDDDPADPMHYRFDYGDNHRDARICVDCHEHRFSDSHASGKLCTDCHQYDRPVPRHTGFGLPRDCIKCHDGIVGSRMNVMGQFRDGKSHHVQTDDGEVTNRHCYACHFEANYAGLINLDVINDGSGDRIAHEGYDYLNHTSDIDKKVDLVIWEPGQRPVDFDITAPMTVQHNGTKYTCISRHDSSSFNEPGVGEDWKLYWQDSGPAGGEAAWSGASVSYSAPTAVTFLAAGLQGTHAEERAQVSNVTPHCLGCHDYKNNETKVFDVVDQDNGDCRTPNQYAWDGTGVGERYSNPYTTAWGKYSQVDYPNVNARDTMIKAFSAHGNAVANAGGYSVGDSDLDGLTDGLDEDLSSVNTRAGGQNVQCYDCHSSHGSKVSGITSSYATFDGSYNGANLKETQAGAGGYYINYMGGKNTSGVNPYEAGADQCFDCHEVQTGSPQAGNSTPWGYNSTFEADEPVLHFYDTERMAGLYTDKHGIRKKLPFKQALTGMGGHLQASFPIEKVSGTSTNSPASATQVEDSGKSWSDDEWIAYYVMITSGNNSGRLRRIADNTATVLIIDDPATALVESFAYDVGTDDYKIVPYAKPIGGLCAPCHDPHGVSPTLGADMAYAVPLLKGTWMTSPYKEDVPPLLDDGYGNSEGFRNYRGNEGESDKPYPLKANPQPSGVWRTDRNTFIQDELSNKNNRPQSQITGYDRIDEDVDRFAGLCLRCHPKDVLADETDVAVLPDDAPFRSLGRIHSSVKGWGDNKEHSFPCSKCHQPHSSGLGKLMVTNCLDIEHRGRDNAVEGYPGPLGWMTAAIPGNWWWNYGNFPQGWGSMSASACHGGKSPNSGSWNPEGTTTGRDKIRWPYNQDWNDVTPW